MPAPTGVARATPDGAAGWRVGSHPLGASGSRPRDPCTLSFSPADGLRRRGALESVWMHGLLAARVAVGLKRRRGRSGRRHYLYPFGSGRRGPHERRPSAPRALHAAAPRPESNPCVAGGATNTYSVICVLCEPRASTVTRVQHRTVTAIWLCWRAVIRTSADTSPEPRPAGVQWPGPAPALQQGPSRPAPRRPRSGSAQSRTVTGGRRVRTTCRAARRAHLLVTSARTRTAGAPAVARPSATL